MSCVAVWSRRKLVQWNVIVLYPFCVRATLHVPVKSLPPNPSAIHNSLYCNNMKSSQWGQKGQAQNNSVIFVQVTKCYIDKTLVSGIPVTSVSWGSVTTKSRVSEHCYNIVMGCHVAHITSTDTLLFNSPLNKCFRIVALPVKTTKMLFLSKICCWFKSKV